ncbi:MAG TPA: carboxypeptidase-like regulatory domain-containing protein [Bryobacteraceae bacterium]|jgi:hypothetical protein|nr:carboxypeptidase-like regulatory domain-containing protein [Bryobacteraceae bacterium]
MRNFLGLIFFSLIFSASAQTTYIISGTVVMGSSNKPVRNALVTIAEVSTRSLKFSCLTGEDGRFTFGNLPATKFSLSAEKHNASPEFFHETEGYSTAIVTGPGLNSENITFPLITGGSISGTVRDDDGDPVRDAQVMLLRRGVFAGRFHTNFEKQQQSDSSGAFHFGHLIAGNYLIAIQARPWYAQNGLMEAGSAVRSELDVAYPVTYSGSTTDPNSASPVSVAEGASATVEITLHAEPAVHVELLHPNTETRNPGLTVFAIGPGGFTIPMNGSFIDTGKHQEFTGIPPGRYEVVEPGGPRKTVDLSGDSSLEIGDTPGSSLSGRVIVDGQPVGSNILVVLSSDTAHVQPEVSPDGSFVVSGVAPGRYQVELANAPGYYVTSVEVGGRPSPDGKIDVAEGSAVQVSIVATKAVYHVDGTALKDGDPFAGAIVLLLPNDITRTSLIRRDQSDSDGTFTLPSVAPGEYTLLAIDDGRDLAYADPAAIKPYLGRGRKIKVPLSSSSPAKVNVAVRQP